jgi:inosose dehydratase
MGKDAGERAVLLKQVAMINVGNAPCSWGTLEFVGDSAGANQITFQRMLDECAATGYAGTELGDWGYMPTQPEVLRSELSKRRLVMTGAFVPVRFKDREQHRDGELRAVRTAQLLAAVSESEHPPFLVLSDDNASDPRRARHAGRVTPDMMLTRPEWQTFADGVNHVAGAVADRTGLRTVYHHHCAGFVETPEEIERLLALTDPATIGLVFDTGHYALGSRHPDAQGVLDALDRFGERIWYVHLKDCSPAVARRAAAEGWDYNTAIMNGIFCELGQGCVPFAEVVVWLRHRNYHGFVTVEQDVLPGMGTPMESARRNREYLTSIGV